MLSKKQSKTTILQRFSKNFAKFRQGIVFLITTRPNDRIGYYHFILP